MPKRQQAKLYAPRKNKRRGLIDVAHVRITVEHDRLYSQFRQAFARLSRPGVRVYQPRRLDPCALVLERSNVTPTGYGWLPRRLYALAGIGAKSAAKQREYTLQTTKLAPACPLHSPHTSK